MKQLKFLAIALTLLMGTMTLSSCFDSEGDSTRSGSAIVRITSSMGMPYFRTSDGGTISVTESSLNSVAANGYKVSEHINEIVWIYYQWDSDVLDIADDAKDISGVELVGIGPMASPVEIVTTEGAPNDSIGNMPVIDLGRLTDTNSSTGTESSAAYFDQNTLLLPINYYIYRYSHSFTLVYDTDSSTDGNILTLYLRHNKQNDKQVNTSCNNSRSMYYYGGYLNLYVRAFDLTNAVGYFRNVNNGVEPDYIRIVFHKSSSTVEQNDTQLTSYDYEYSPN